MQVSTVNGWPEGTEGTTYAGWYYHYTDESEEEGAPVAADEETTNNVMPQTDETMNEYN